MATTSKHLVTSKAIGGQAGDGNNGRYGLKAKVAAGVAILGCAAALAFGGLRSVESLQSPSVASAANTAQANGRERQLFLDQNLWLPSGTLASVVTTHEQLLFLEQNTELPVGGASAPRLDWETIRLIEQNILPETAPITGPALVPPSPVNLRSEDH